MIHLNRLMRPLPSSIYLMIDHLTSLCTLKPLLLPSNSTHLGQVSWFNSEMWLKLLVSSLCRQRHTAQQSQHTSVRLCFAVLPGHACKGKRADNMLTRGLFLVAVPLITTSWQLMNMHLQPELL